MNEDELIKKLRDILNCVYVPTIKLEIKKLIKDIKPTYDLTTDTFKKE